jgi:general secretion pathway protein D
LGWLFKSVHSSGEKTNLYVFLTPRVVNNPAEATTLYQQKKDQFDKIEEGNIKMYEKTTKEPKSDSPKTNTLK